MFAVVRIRGSVKVRKEIKDTLSMLNLKRVNHCVVVPDTLQYKGMLKKVKDYVTFGETNEKTLSMLLKKRGELVGNKKIDGKSLKRVTNFDSFEKFSEALIKGKVKLKDSKEIKPVFRLNPPRHGFKSIRLPYPRGDLGNRKEKINELIERMI